MKTLLTLCLLLLFFCSYLAYSNVQLSRENGRYQMFMYMLEKHIESQNEGKQGT